MKRLKNIENKNKEQLENSEYRGEQLDMIDKQGKKQLKAINNQEEQLKKLRVKKNC